MKKRILAIILALCIWASVPASAAAGAADDPLISRSYISETFFSQIMDAMEGILQKKLDSVGESGQTSSGLTVLSVAKGETLTLKGGQQLILISGSVRLTIETGKLLNVTAGRSSIGGDANLGHRYLVRAGSLVTAAAKSEAVVAVSVGVKPSDITPESEPETETAKPDGACPFSDGRSSDWYYADVVSAYSSGLVNGITATGYAPMDKLTTAQAIKLAACMHQLYHIGGVSLKNASDGRAWYMSYVEYAEENRLLPDGLPSYEQAISRRDFIRIFYLALPEKEYARVNLIMDGAIPDVATDAAIAKEVYTFYMAGILTGYTAADGCLEHSFLPDSTISRAEVAAIMKRMFHPEMRKRFSIE